MNANAGGTAPPVEQLSPADSATPMWARNNVERRHHSLSWQAGEQSLSPLEQARGSEGDAERRKSLCGGAAWAVEGQTFTPAAAGICFGAVALIVWRAMEITAFSRCSSGMFFTMF